MSGSAPARHVQSLQAAGQEPQTSADPSVHPPRSKRHHHTREPAAAFKRGGAMRRETPCHPRGRHFPPLRTFPAMTTDARNRRTGRNPGLPGRCPRIRKRLHPECTARSCFPFLPPLFHSPQNGSPLIGRSRAPRGDFVERAQTSFATAGLLIEAAKIDAGRRNDVRIGELHGIPCKSGVPATQRMLREKSSRGANPPKKLGRSTPREGVADAKRPRGESGISCGSKCHPRC